MVQAPHLHPATGSQPEAQADRDAAAGARRRPLVAPKQQPLKKESLTF
jgi:hypothetical protein